MGLEVNVLEKDFVIEVIGLDLRQPVSDKDFISIRDAWFKAGVMVIRDQHITPAQQVAFSAKFGPLGMHVLDQFLHPEQKEVLILSNKKHDDGTPAGFEDAGRYWHSDLSYAEKPMLGSMLYAIEIPPQGGDTLFVDMRKALDNLPAEVRERIDGRWAYHSYTRDDEAKESVDGLRPVLSAKQIAKLSDVMHPIVRTHEDTGDKALFVNPGFTFAIENMSEEECEKLLKQLFKHSTKPELIYTHCWQPRDLLCWDNRTVMHQATQYDSSYTRHMHRTTIEGTKPF